MSKAANAADTAAEKANETIASLEANLENAHQKVKEVGEAAGQIAEELGVDAKELAADSVSSVESFIREKPLQAAGIAFGAGVLATMLLRRRG